MFDRIGPAAAVLVAAILIAPSVSAESPGPADAAVMVVNDAFLKFGGCLHFGFTFYYTGPFQTGPYLVHSQNLTFFLFSVVINQSLPIIPSWPPDLQNFLEENGVPPWVFEDRITFLLWAWVDLECVFMHSIN